MSALRVFTQQPRSQILRSNINHSTSKQSWTFSKQQRFSHKIPNCPYVSYDKNISTISNIKTRFGTDRRRVFTEYSEAPASWNYDPYPSISKDSKKKGKSIALGRQEVIANSYIDKEIVKNPGPGRYEAKSEHAVSYSVRPKTANHRNYFIEDKEHNQVPGPGNYEAIKLKITGKNQLSKFKTNIAGVIGKDSRFKPSSNGIPPSWAYENGPRNAWVHGAKIGVQQRTTFTETAAKSFTPGPGNYRLPTQFAHYKPYKRYTIQRIQSAKHS